MSEISKAILDKPLIWGIGDLDRGLSVMQLVDYLSTGGTSRHPKCADPILTTYATEWCLAFTHDDRQKLKPLAASLVGTRGGDLWKARKRLIMWRNVTAAYPRFLDHIGASEQASALRMIENTNGGMAEAASYLSASMCDIKGIAKENPDAHYEHNAYTDATLDAHANAIGPHGYAHADVNAYHRSLVYTAAYDFAKAYHLEGLREDLASIAIETLCMAIEEK